VTSDERRLRAQIVEAGRRLWLCELVGGGEGNLSARLPDGRLLATPAGRSKWFLVAEELVVLEADGSPVDPSAPPPSTEIALHLAAYAARPGTGAVVHAHPLAALAHAMAGRPLEILVPEAGFAPGAAVPVAPFALPGTPAVGESVRPLLLAGYDVVLLDRHGAVALGPDPLAAAEKLEIVERAARLSLWIRILEPRV
jgi:L-fuculose-phosphate aldolase